MWKFTPSHLHDFQDLLSWGKAAPQAFPGGPGGAKMGQPGMRADRGLAGFAPTGMGRARTTGHRLRPWRSLLAGFQEPPQGSHPWGPWKAGGIRSWPFSVLSQVVASFSVPPQNKGEERNLVTFRVLCESLFVCTFWFLGSFSVSVKTQEGKMLITLNRLRGLCAVSVDRRVCPRTQRPSSCRQASAQGLGSCSVSLPLPEDLGTGPLWLEERLPLGGAAEPKWR